MATYEIYQGGPRQQNANFAMLPAATFSASQPYTPAVQQIPVAYAPPRALDFSGNDEALSQFLIENPLVTNDVLGSAPIPKDSLLYGVWWQVKTPLTGVSFSLYLRVAGTNILTTTSAATAASGFATPVAPVYLNTGAEMVDVKLDAVPAAGVKGLVIQVAPYYIYFTGPAD